MKIEALADRIVEVIRDHVRSKTAPLEEQLRGLVQRADARDAEVRALHQRVAELERKGLWAGTEPERDVERWQ
jgi:BMFP domain-containing protein YqiC